MVTLPRGAERFLHGGLPAELKGSSAGGWGKKGQEKKKKRSQRWLRWAMNEREKKYKKKTKLIEIKLN